VDEVRIGELGLLEGQCILYLFDYGDEWRFQIALEAIRKSGAKPRKPKIVEQKGKAPKQYENYWDGNMDRFDRKRLLQVEECSHADY